MQRFLKRFSYIFMICLVLSGGCITVEYRRGPIPEHLSMGEHAHSCYCDCCDISGPRPPPVLSPASEYKHAVLICAGVTNADRQRYNSAYWYDLMSQYLMLRERGFNDENIHVLYGYDGEDYYPGLLDYNSAHLFGKKITDMAISKANIESVFQALGGKRSDVNCVSRALTDEDYLYIWWMGHGGSDPGTCNLYLPISVTGEEFTDVELSNCINQVSHYKKRVVAVMTCFSSGILDDMINEKGVNTVTLASSSCDEYSYDIWPTCDRRPHAEFNYKLTEAIRQMDICNKPLKKDPDTNPKDGYVSLAEACDYIAPPMRNPTAPRKISDPDKISDSTYFNEPNTP
ncbi:MAG: hypothetical protein B6D35_10545 [Candidatus Brocadia sp. UTAMX2]|nr:MAG: hypothetical protein B6D35_10545 [Candidatus Brocadia sp. UTAMX2]